MKTTVGQILVNSVLPPSLRDYTRVIDKKSLADLLKVIAEKYPEKYREISHGLSEIGISSATSMGTTVSLEGLLPQASRKALVAVLQAKAQRVIDSNLPDDEKEEQIIKIYKDSLDSVIKTVYETARKEGNPFAQQVMSGARGNPSQLNSLIGADLLRADHHGRLIPIPLVHSFSEGLDPAEYWADTYGARQGQIATKFATQRAGYLGKQLSRATHRMIVTENDCGTTAGIVVPASEADNAGALLASPVSGLRRNQIMTPKLMKKLGKNEIMLRSPITCEAEGICSKCAGIRERGSLPHIGDHVGIAAAQALSERLSQSQLGVKHTGGDAKGASTILGFDLINQLTNVPKHFAEEAAISTIDGRVSKIEQAPQGGWYVSVGDEQVWSQKEPTVRVGQTVEAGDILSEGIANPAKVVQYKGIGEGRKQFLYQFGKAFRDSGLGANRRNIEIFARGLINHVQISDPNGVGDALPDDIVSFDMLRRNYKPRTGYQTLPATQAVGQYLEKPALHYTIGTRVTPSIVKQLQRYKIPKIAVHPEAPGFQPRMVRVGYSLKYDPDWMTRLMGERLGESTLRAVHRGQASTERSTSFVPSLARGVEFKGPGTGKF